MKSKQLANVLVKILGLYICVSAIPACVSGIIIVLTSRQSAGDMVVMRTLATSLGAAVQAAVGIVMITASHKNRGILVWQE